MKKSFIIAGLIALASSLAACGGGGGSSPSSAGAPPVVATLAPAYSARISWTGAMHPTGQLASSLRRAMAAGTATPLPVMIAAQVCALGQNCNDIPYSNEGYPQHGATLSMTIAPSPSATVVPTWAPVTGAAPIQTPYPGDATAPPGQLIVNASTAAGQDTTSATAVVSGSTLSQNTTVNVYPALALGCGSAYPGLWSAVSFANGQATKLSSPSGADLYVDGPYCTGAFLNASESGTTLHVPNGGALVKTDRFAFIDVGVAQWSNAFTSTPAMQFPSASDPTQAIMIFKTGLGNYVKMLVLGRYSDNPSLPANYELSWEQSGSSVDGKF